MAESFSSSTLFAFTIIVYSSTRCLASSFQYACDNGTSFSLIFWEQRPYIYRNGGEEVNGALPEILRKTFKSCCKRDPIMSGEKLKYPESLRDTIGNHFDKVILPVGRRIRREETIFLRPFLGLIDSPGMAVIVLKTTPGQDLIAAILQSWPILIFIVMSVSLSAIAMWVLEYRSNPDEFPTNFPEGVFEAFWWAAVTMTTVGYGDKVPRSVSGRLFGVVWINVGLVILAIFMGMITASLSSNSLEQINNLYGMPVSVMNGTAEQQLAVLQNAEVHVKTKFDDLYKSVSREESRLALVDLYSTTQHNIYYDKYALYVATVLSEPVIIGAVLPNGSAAVRNCFLSYQQEHQLELHEIVEKFIKTDKYYSEDSSLGVEYFQGSMFGYTVYGMLGLFVVALGVGVFWQYFPWKKKEQEIPSGKENAGDANKEAVLHCSVEVGGRANVNHTRNGSQHTERLMAAQSAEVLAMEDELKAFRKNWEKSFRNLQERHRKEQERFFELDNFGYEM
ncbi:uncharacterized protein [Montipora foliosa]|uniref:uncharacterized protein n=1 Tax=Montipora foliosa TaxID=591990 RepID=UPI0035F12452